MLEAAFRCTANDGPPCVTNTVNNSPCNGPVGTICDPLSDIGGLYFLFYI